MKLNTKQIKKLKSLSHHIKPIITIGKEGVNEGVINSITEYLERHELIKIKFNKNKSEKNTLSENITNSTAIILRTGRTRKTMLSTLDDVNFQRFPR